MNYKQIRELINKMKPELKSTGELITVLTSYTIELEQLFQIITHTDESTIATTEQIDYITSLYAFAQTERHQDKSAANVWVREAILTRIEDVKALLHFAHQDELDMFIYALIQMTEEFQAGDVVLPLNDLQLKIASV